MKKILVIGDSCDDIYRYGECKRLCPEGPVPVFLPQEFRMNVGMALNVAENIRALGGECDVLTNTKRPTKTRLVDDASSQIIVRIDENDDVDRIDGLDEVEFGEYQAVVISDYDKGFLYEEDIEYISKNHGLIFLDTKKKISDWASSVSVIKINQKEFEANLDWLLGSDVDLIVTNGSDGATLNCTQRFPVREYAVRDLTGAGDTFLAALVVAYLDGHNIERAIEFANKCASWVVTQKGVVVVDKNKI